jgi:hypothetical protein
LAYPACLFYPAQMHAFARALISGEARFGYVPSKQEETNSELMRLQHQPSR